MQPPGRRRFLTKGHEQMDAVATLFHRLVLRQDDGQDLIEYALLTGLISIVAIAAMTVVGTTINTMFWETFTSVIAGVL
jgi:pilus assembly protein Flp/PilA